MTDYTALATAVKTTFESDAWLGDVNNVKTIEIDKRGFSMQDLKDALFFSPADLPAIAIVSNAAGKRQNLGTTNEIRETVPVEVSAVSRARNAQSGLNTHRTIVQNIERVLESQKSSAKNLGIDAFVESAATTEDQEKKGDYYYFISATTAQIELTAVF